MSVRDELIALNLATELHHSIDDADGEHYTSIGVRTNEDAADVVLAWLEGHDADVRSQALLDAAHSIAPSNEPSDWTEYAQGRADATSSLLRWRHSSLSHDQGPRP